MNLVVSGIQRSVFVGFIVVNVVGAEIFKVAYPEHATGVNIASTQFINALNEQTTVDDLLGRPVSVSRQNIHVAAAAEP